MRLSKNLPPFLPVPLDDKGAMIRLRAARTPDVEAASIEVGNQMVALTVGGEKAAALADLLPDFDFGLLTQFGSMPAQERQDLFTDLGFRNRLAMLSERLVLIRLIGQCNDGWSGISNDAGELIEKPDPLSIALLVLDPSCERRCRMAIYSRVHAELDEKNGSAASPAGGAAEVTNPALPADPPATPAPSAG